jgi:hypothetical protein
MKKFLLPAFMTTAMLLTTGWIHQSVPSAPPSGPSYSQSGPSYTPEVPKPPGDSDSTPIGTQVAQYRQQVAIGQQQLQILDRQIRDVQQQISMAEQDYAKALAQLNEKPTPPPPPQSIASPTTVIAPPTVANEARGGDAAAAIVGTWRRENGDLYVFSVDGTVVAIGDKGKWLRHSRWAVENNAVAIYWPDGGWDKFLLPIDPRNTINANKDGDHFVYSKVASP